MLTGILLTVLMGWLLALVTLRHAPPGLFWSFVPGLGLGLASLSFMGGLLLGIRTEISTTLMLGVLAAAVGLSRSFPRWRFGGGLPGGFALLAGAVVLAAMAFFLTQSQYFPFGQGDSLAIWNVKARMLFGGRESTLWHRAFGTAVANGDYPPLVSAAVAFLWFWGEPYAVTVPQTAAFVSTFATVGVLAAGLAQPRNGAQRVALGVSLLALTPAFLGLGESQCSDIPLGLFFLMTLVVWLQAQTQPGRRLWVACGITTGMALFTKHEGLPFWAIFLGLHALAHRRSWQQGLYRAGFILLGNLPFLLAWGYIKARVIVRGSAVFYATPQQQVVKLFDPHRYLTILKAYWATTPQFGDWVFTPFLVLVALAAVARRVPRPQHRWGWGLLGGQSLVYVGIYLITAAALDWHLSTSLNRLLMQLFPSFLFLFLVGFQLPARNRPTVLAAPASSKAASG